MEDREKITLSREELNAMLEESAKRGADEARKNDAEDAEALEFIASFEPAEGRSALGDAISRVIAGGRDKLKKARAKLEAFNDFESKLEPYYDYADDPEEVNDLDAGELERYARKHEIYMKLHAEKIRRFGLLGFQRGIMNTSMLDELGRALSAGAPDTEFASKHNVC